MSEKRTLTLSVEGMTCASCVGRVERTLAGIPGVSDAAVNLANETARVSFAAPANLAGLIDTLGEAGYPATTSEITLDVEGMTCASCVGRVERKLTASDGVIDAQVNLAAETATIRYATGATTPADLARIPPNLDTLPSSKLEKTSANRTARRQRSRDLGNLPWSPQFWPYRFL